MDQDVQSRVEELEQNVQAKDRELAQSQQELRQKVYHIIAGGCMHIVQLFLQDEQLHSCQRDLAQSQQQIRLKVKALSPHPSLPSSLSPSSLSSFYIFFPPSLSHISLYYSTVM